MTENDSIEMLGRDALARLTDLATRANDLPYRLETVIEEKCFGIGADGAPHAFGATAGGDLVGVAVVAGRYLRLLAVDRSHRRRGVGARLLDEALRLVQTHGEARLVVGAEPGNYFAPGLLNGSADQRTFFGHHGFVDSATATNLVAELAHDWSAYRAPLRGIETRRATREEAETLLDFVGREFGRLWRFEVSHAFETAEPIPLFVAWRGAEPVGFSAHDVNNRGLGFYGPAGVLSSLRGGGVGRDLLLCSLADLRERGYDRTIIPWVSSVDFYRKVAFAELDSEFQIVEKRFV